MSDRLLIIRSCDETKSLRMSQERFSRRGSLLWYPPVSTTRNLEDGFRGVNVIENFRTVEDGVDAAVPVDAKNAPTSDLENCKERSFPQRPHRSFFLQEEKERRRTLQLCQSDCLNRGVHPSSVCPFLCPLPMSSSSKCAPVFDLFAPLLTDWESRLYAKGGGLLNRPGPDHPLADRAQSCVFRPKTSRSQFCPGLSRSPVCRRAHCTIGSTSGNSWTASFSVHVAQPCH
jgi:hypothetical protein